MTGSRPTHPISIVEDLDPEPSQRGAFQRGELFLGVALLLGVLIWAGWQWRHQQQVEGHYHVAVEAVARKEWDAARHNFLAAGDYKDAPHQAAEALRLISERDRDYASALESVQRGEWLGSLYWLEAVRSVQPSFRNSDTLLAQAKHEVARTALSGTVALRTLADPPGLYFHGGGEWRYLPGSDGWSAVHATASGGLLLYDVPGPGWQPVAPAPDPRGAYTDRLPEPGSPALKGRKLVVARAAVAVEVVQELAADPGEYNLYLLAEKGLWALRYDILALLNNRFYPIYRYSPSSNDSGLITNYNDYRITYFPLDGSASPGVELPGGDWVVADLLATGDGVLLAQLNAPSESRATSHLFLADGSGGQPRLLFSHRGAFRSVRSSPDGRYALVETYNRLMGGRNARQAVMLLHLDGSAPPRTIIENIMETRSEDMFFGVGATFLDTGPLAGNVLAARWGTTSSIVRIVDPADERAPLFESRVRDHPAGILWVGQSREYASVALAWHTISWPAERRPGVGRSLSLSIVSRGKPARTVQLPLEEGELLRNLSLEKEHVVYTTQSRLYRTRVGVQLNINSIPVSSVESRVPAAKSVFNTSMMDPHPYSLAPEYAVGPNMLVCAVGGDARVRTYDGLLDVPVEEGIGAIYPLYSSHPNWLW